MLANHPMTEQTQHMRALNELIHERNLVGQPTSMHGSMMNLAEAVSQSSNLAETGHVFDHEPGYADYHHGHQHHAEEDEHAEYYGDARYPLFNLEEDAIPDIFQTAKDDHYHHGMTDHRFHHYDDYQHYHMNEAESNLYHSWPVYSPVVSHDWTLHHKPKRVHGYSDQMEADMFSNSGADGYGAGQEDNEI